MAAPTWVAAGTKTEKPSDVGATSTVAPPAGHASGDLLVIAAIANANHTVSTPGGWTLLGSKTSWGTSSQFNSYLFWKLAASSSEASVTITTNAASYCDSQMYAFRGVDVTTPIDAATVYGAVSGVNAVATPAITTATNDALMVFMGFDVSASAWATPPTGATERVETSVYIARLVVATETKTTAGTEAADTYTRTGASGAQFAFIAAFAIRPIVAVTPPVANFTGTPLTGTMPLEVAFTDTSTNTPTSWAWDFGDGDTDTVQNPSHEYAAAGTYTVELEATNAGGTDTETKTGYVVVDPRTGRFSRIKLGPGLTGTDLGDGVLEIDVA